MLSEVPSMIDFLFLEDPAYDEAAVSKTIESDPAAGQILDAALDAYASAAFEPTVLHEATVALSDGLGMKLRKTQAPIRVAVTGRSVGPPLFESLALLGRAEVIRRLELVRGRASR